MSFNSGIGFDIGFEETKRRRKKSFSPDFTGDLDLEKLSRGMPFPTSESFGKQSAKNLLLGQRGRIESTPTRLRAEGNLQDAFLTNPLAAPSVDPSRKSNGKRKKNRRDRGRKSLVKEAERLRRGGQPRTSKQTIGFSSSDLSFRSVI